MTVRTYGRTDASVLYCTGALSKLSTGTVVHWKSEYSTVLQYSTRGLVWWFVRNVRTVSVHSLFFIRFVVVSHEQHHGSTEVERKKHEHMD